MQELAAAIQIAPRSTNNGALPSETGARLERDPHCRRREGLGIFRQQPL